MEAGWPVAVGGDAIVSDATPGIGSLLDRFTYVDGNLQMITLAILTIVVAVTALNRLVWRPLYAAASDRFRLEY